MSGSLPRKRRASSPLNDYSQDGHEIAYETHKKSWSGIKHHALGPTVPRPASSSSLTTATLSAQPYASASGTAVSRPQSSIGGSVYKNDEEEDEKVVHDENDENEEDDEGDEDEDDAGDHDDEGDDMEHENETNNSRFASEGLVGNGLRPEAGANMADGDGRGGLAQRRPSQAPRTSSLRQTPGQNSPSAPRKRQRIRLSCLECRRRKLSCDRAFPCERCIKSGTPDRCSYESKPGPRGTVKAGIPQATFAPAHDYRRSTSVSVSVKSPGLPLQALAVEGSSRAKTGSGTEVGAIEDVVKNLEKQLAQVKAMLSMAKEVGGMSGNGTGSGSGNSHGNFNGSGKNGVASMNKRGSADLDSSNEVPDVRDPAKEQPPPREVTMKLLDNVEEVRFFRGREFRTRFFGPHNACMAFAELKGIGPFVKETADEWLKPNLYFCHKDRKQRYEDRERAFSSPDAALDALLPPRHEADVLVEVYLDQFEQLYRIVHMPTFRKQYATFWTTGEARYGAFTALVLAMMAVSVCMHTPPAPKVLGPQSASHQKAERWIWACEEWNERQSQKHRRLIHYQIACLLYLGKRVNTLKKKRFWTTSGTLVSDGISVGLHRDPSHMCNRISPFNQEMRRRIWATIQELNMQASFDYGLPTLLSQLHYDVDPPRNLDDEAFDENTTQLPPSRPTKEYTVTSYQHLSRRSLPLRLRLGHILTGQSNDLDYDIVIRYTNDITHEIDALPSWDVGPSDSKLTTHKPLLAYTLLHIQLRQYLIPLHQPYLRLRQKNSKYQYSEIIYYNAARDMVLLHDKLSELGIRTLYFIREDALTTAINLCSVTMLQPRGSTNMIMINSHHTLNLMQKCLAMKSDRLLRCGNNEPWGYSIMCAAFGLLEAHLGLKTTEAAKIASVQRFVDLLYKQVGGQQAYLAHQRQASAGLVANLEVGTDSSVSASSACAAIGTAAGVAASSVSASASGPASGPASSAHDVSLRDLARPIHDCSSAVPSSSLAPSSSSLNPRIPLPIAPTSTAYQRRALPASGLALPHVSTATLPSGARSDMAVAHDRQHQQHQRQQYQPQQQQQYQHQQPQFSPAPQSWMFTPINAWDTAAVATGGRSARAGGTGTAASAGGGGGGGGAEVSAGAAGDGNGADVTPPEFNLEVLGLNINDLWGGNWYG